MAIRICRGHIEPFLGGRAGRRGQRWHHSKERWWFPIGSPLWPLRYVKPLGSNLQSNVSNAQMNRGWVTLGPNLGVDWLSSVLRPLQHSIGYMGDGFYRSKDPTNSIKLLKEKAVKENNTKKTQRKQKLHICMHTQNSRPIQHTSITQQVPWSTIIWGD